MDFSACRFDFCSPLRREEMRANSWHFRFGTKKATQKAVENKAIEGAFILFCQKWNENDDDSAVVKCFWSSSWPHCLVDSWPSRLSIVRRHTLLSKWKAKKAKNALVLLLGPWVHSMRQLMDTFCTLHTTLKVTFLS